MIRDDNILCITPEKRNSPIEENIDYDCLIRTECGIINDLINKLTIEIGDESLEDIVNKIEKLYYEKDTVYEDFEKYKAVSDKIEKIYYGVRNLRGVFNINGTLVFHHSDQDYSIKILNGALNDAVDGFNRYNEIVEILSRYGEVETILRDLIFRLKKIRVSFDFVLEVIREKVNNLYKNPIMGIKLVLCKSSGLEWLDHTTVNEIERSKDVKKHDRGSFTEEVARGIYKGYEYYVEKHSPDWFKPWFTGYVMLPVNHPYINKHYDEVCHIDIYEGYIYSSRKGDIWVLGHDSNILSKPDLVDENYMKTECEKVIDQIKKDNKGIQK